MKCYDNLYISFFKLLYLLYSLFLTYFSLSITSLCFFMTIFCCALLTSSGWSCINLLAHVWTNILILSGETSTWWNVGKFAKRKKASRSYIPLLCHEDTILNRVNSYSRWIFSRQTIIINDLKTYCGIVMILNNTFRSLLLCFL